MSTSEVLEQSAAPSSSQQRRVVNAIWQPFLQFKLLMYMLGLTAVVAVLLGVFLYYAFSDLIGTVAMESGSRCCSLRCLHTSLNWPFSPIYSPHRATCSRWLQQPCTAA